MWQILILGSGKIGSLIATLLNEQKDYQVYVASASFECELPKAIQTFTLDMKDEKTISDVMQKNNINVVISSLPFYLNTNIAKLCVSHQCHYFDLTEDVETTQVIKSLAHQSQTIFVPQCGLAPGFINIVSNHLIQYFDTCLELKLRVGGLPQYTQNTLKYALTWSLDGLINQYINPCPVIKNGSLFFEPALENLESICLDGAEYEAFNTSGGIGHLARTVPKSIKELNYKTIRYPGHCEKIKFLLNDLRLRQDREIFAKFLRNGLPESQDDVVIIYVSANGIKAGKWIEKHYFHKILPCVFAQKKWSAMQTATASSVCAVIDLVLNSNLKKTGLVVNESLDFNDFINNRFAHCFR